MFRRAAIASFGAGTILTAGAKGSAAQPSSPGPTVKDVFALRKQGKKIPVIFDTDIGGDIDDTWALVMLLKSPELDVRMVVSDNGNAVYRSKLLAKLLEACGRTDIPVGLGIEKDERPSAQTKWVGDYQLSQYPGEVHEDGVGAMIEMIRRSTEPISLVCVGPVPNISAALKRDPTIANRSRFVGMHSSVRRGYGGRAEPSAEWNVRAKPGALQDVFAAPWEITITPLDTCGIVNLQGDRYQKVYRCPDPGVRALMENYDVWAANKDPQGKSIDPTTRSSTLFDTVAVYLAYSETLLPMEELPLRVTNKGFTVIDKKGKRVRCATRWKDLEAFKDHLVTRLTT